MYCGIRDGDAFHDTMARVTGRSMTRDGPGKTGMVWPPGPVRYAAGTIFGRPRHPGLAGLLDVVVYALCLPLALMLWLLLVVAAACCDVSGPPPRPSERP